MRKSKLLICLMVIFVFLSFLAKTMINVNATNETSTSITVSAKTFEFDAKNDYNFSTTTGVSTMSYGKKQMGSLTISGNITETSNFKNKPAYGIGDDSVISFSYSYDGTYQTSVKEDWNLRSDSGTKVDEFNLSGSIDKGALLVQTSSNGSTWSNVVNPITNFYATNTSGKTNFYTTDGSAVAQGTYYRVILAYQTGRKTGESGMLWWKEDVYEDKRHVELYEFYLVVNSGTISIHNLAVDESSLPEIEGFTQETIKRGETLLDGSTTTKGFSIDKLGTSYLVSVSKDDGTASYVNDGDSFTEDGKYTITTITKLGKQLTQTVYVFSGGDDSGYSTYFGDSIVDGNRIFRYDDYPTYAKGSSININAVASNVPMLTGQITNLTTNEEFILASNRNEQIFDLVPGFYCADFYSGETTSGTIYHYKAYFNIIDEDSGPYVNFDNLIKTERLSDLTTKHYEVAYQTTAGGYIFVCFSLDSYDEAFNYAYEIEKRFIEQTNDGLYYKSQDNPNVKVKYYDYVAMTSVLNYYARQNVEYNYFNPIDAFTYQTYENNLLEQLETLSIRESIKVFPSQSEKNKLINRQPFINDFTFIKVGDYDVVSVNAYCHKNGKNYLIEFGKDVSQQLTVSSKYTITETNVYGDTKVYEVYYVNENQTSSVWSVNYNGVDSILNVSSSILVNNKIEINADSISIVSIENNFDINSIVTIKAPSVYSFEIKCLISELENVGLYKKGKYELTFVDRVGNSYQLIINITGKSRYSDVVTMSTRSYTNFYNALYINDRTESEEIIYDITALKTAIDRVVDANFYTVSSFANYTRYLNEARAMYENQEASQNDINVATSNLEKAFLSLVKTVDKTELFNELKKFQALNKGIYTSDSYNIYKIAYDSAIAIYEKDEPTLDEISISIQELHNAYNSLLLKGDKTLLYSKMKEIRNVDCSLYTPNSVESLNETYEQAVIIFDNIDATQDEIDSIIILLTNKMSELVYIADFSELLNIIQQVQSIDKTLYTSASIEHLKIKYNEAVAIYKDRNSTQSVIYSIKNDLVKAKNGLIICGNSTELKTLVDEIAEISYMIYSKETIEPLLNKYNEALILLSGRFTQTKIDTVKNDLKSLKNSIVIREYKEELYNILIELSQIDVSGYSKDKQENLVSAYNSAMNTLKSLDSTEEEVCSAKYNFEIAIENLESKDGMHWRLWVLLIILAIVGVILLICWIYYGFIEGYWDEEIYPWIQFVFGIILLVGSILIMIFCK